MSQRPGRRVAWFLCAAAVSQRDSKKLSLVLDAVIRLDLKLSCKEKKYRSRLTLFVVNGPDV